MNAQATSPGIRPPSIRDYASDKRRGGTSILPGSRGTIWARYEAGTMLRLPTFRTTPPAPGEVRRALWRGPATAASFVVEPDERHPANAWLYLCTDRAYTLEKLSHSMRKNVRRGLKELRVTPLGKDQLLAHGARAFCDTRRRVGLDDGTPDEFRRRYAGRAAVGQVFLGAWKDDQLAAFLSMTAVEEWVEINGWCSMDAWLHLRPNDTLMYSALAHYLTETGCRVVSDGLSSIQATTIEAGLHAFKTKIGFEARPVHRAFVLHPLAHPLANRATLWALRMALRLRPGDRRLKKAEGLLTYIRGDSRLPAPPGERSPGGRSR